MLVSSFSVPWLIGGAGIVAAHAAGLGASVQYVSVTGKDAVRYAHENKIGTVISTSLSINKDDAFCFDF